MLLTLTASVAAAVSADSKDGFCGIEFLGSSQLTRAEIQKFLGLKQGASPEAVLKAVSRLESALEAKRVKTNIEIVSGSEGRLYVAVDVVNPGSSEAIQTRKLSFPRHVRLLNEKPFTLLADLKTRQIKLNVLEDRPIAERYENGMKYFSDEPCNRLAEREIKELDGQESGLYQIIESDPDASRRSNAIELLNWTPDYLQNCTVLLPALADSDVHVRTQAVKYIWARITLLPDDYPYDQLSEMLCHELRLPSHTDRSKALALLLALCRHHPASIWEIKESREAGIKEIAETSIIPNIQKMASELATLCQNAPAPPVKPVYPAPNSAPKDSSAGF